MKWFKIAESITGPFDHYYKSKPIEFDQLDIDLRNISMDYYKHIKKMDNQSIAEKMEKFDIQMKKWHRKQKISIGNWYHNKVYKKPSEVLPPSIEELLKGLEDTDVQSSLTWYK